MKVNEWTETLWGILNIRPRTLLDYKRLYRRQLEPVIGNTEINEVASVDLQKKLLTLPPQTSIHTAYFAMVANLSFDIPSGRLFRNWRELFGLPNHLSNFHSHRHCNTDLSYLPMEQNQGVPCAARG